MNLTGNSFSKGIEFMSDFKSICELYNEFALDISCEDKKIALKDILSSEVCPLIFHSVYPYMVTLASGGWFNWVNYDEHVIVNCPSPEGIAMYVKAPSGDKPNLIEVEVMKDSQACFKGYKIKDKLTFNFNEENKVNFKLLDNLISFVSDKNINNKEINELCCEVEGKRMRCRMTPRE